LSTERLERRRAKMSEFNYHERIFAPLSNSEGGEVSSATVFRYRQKDDVVWATYEGGEVAFGTLVARVLADGSLDMRYSHVNRRGELMTGRCRSTPELLPDGRLRLHERWRWTSGDGSEGESVVEELKRPSQDEG
jgi:hypothetical protein